MLFGEAPSGQYLIEPRLEFLCTHDLEKKMIVDEPYLARLSHTCIETDEGDPRHAIDHSIALACTRFGYPLKLIRRSRWVSLIGSGRLAT